MPGPLEITRRIFVPQSTMADGIRSATAVVSHEVPRTSVKDAVSVASRTQASPLTISEGPTARGTPLAPQEPAPVSPAKGSGVRASVGMVKAGEAAGVVMVGAGVVGASASDGPTGAAIGDRAGRSAGIPGGTTRTGTPLGLIPTTRITATTGTTIRRPTIRIRRINDASPGSA